MSASAWREAVAFLTPLGRSESGPAPEAMSWFPAVGAAIGLTEGAIWRAARSAWPAPVAAVAALAAHVGLTGALHLDGLADTADGLFAHAPDRDRLEIMRAPDIGAFGATALGLVLMARAAALVALDPSPVMLGALACGSRSTMVLAARSMTYVREKGLVLAFLPEDAGSDGAAGAGVAGLVLATVAATLARGSRGAVGMAVGAAAAAALLVTAKRRLGGYTGDVLGAAGTVFETVGLMAVAKRQ